MYSGSNRKDEREVVLVEGPSVSGRHQRPPLMVTNSPRDEARLGLQPRLPAEVCPWRMEGLQAHPLSHRAHHRALSPQAPRDGWRGLPW